jgi:hypothetical protein
LNFFANSLHGYPVGPLTFEIGQVSLQPLRCKAQPRQGNNSAVSAWRLFASAADNT